MTEIKWTKEQEEAIGMIINESESIGYTQGYDDAIREFVKELEHFIFELKKNVFIKKEKDLKNDK
jgi:hypothetical protein